MPRYCLQGRIRPDRIDLYRARHRAVWPELLRALAESGWRDYSLFLGEDGLLVGFVEADDLAAAQAAVAATEVNSAWQQEMSDLFVDLDGAAPDRAWTLLEPVFDLNGQLAAAGCPAPVDLRVEDHRAADCDPGAASDRSRALPVAGSDRPRLSWTVPLVRQGQRQSAYRVVACHDRDAAEPAALADTPGGPAPLWDSGRIESDRTAHVRWDGPRPAAHSTVRWQVRVWDEHGQESPWSRPAALVTGPLTADDWTARWIEGPAGGGVRTEFDLDPREVLRARLHLTGHGLLRAHLDGRPVNADASDPSRTSLTRAAARGYDVTALLADAPRHALAVATGIGHYREVLSRPRLLAELLVEMRDGSTVRVATGPGWRRGPTSVVREDTFYLEEHDARTGDGWTRAGFDSPLWEPAAAAEDPPRTVVPDAGPPVTVVEEIPATRLPTPGAYVFDLGRNIAGRSRVEVRGAAPGTRLEIVHGEKLNAAGHVDTLNIRLPHDRERERQVLAWTCAGGSDTAEAWFAVHGFRYVEVHGLPAGARLEVTGRVLHSDAPVTGRFTSDDPLLDRLVDMAARTQLNNTHAHPEDCPTREAAGWTGDASVSAEAALAHLGMAGVYRHWLDDVAADQRPDGGVLGVAPHLLGAMVQPADPVWGAAMTEIPLQHWRHVGDEDFVARLLPAMRRWCDWQLATLSGGVVRHADISFGADWLAPERTPPVMLQTAAVLRSLRALAELETAAGDPGQATRRARQADALGDSARAVLHDPVTGDWADAGQGSAALALTSGLARDGAESEALRAHLRADVAARGDRVATGFSATQAVVRSLAADDGGTALLAAVHQPAQPGIGAMLADGPGTFWETWWIDDDNAGVASLDHIGLGAPFAAWAWTHVAGLRPLTAGYRRFAVAPRLLGPVGRARGSVDTVRGRIDFGWRYDAGTLTADLEVPVGATAELSLPGVGAQCLTVDGVPAAEHEHAVVAGDAVELPAGRYRLAAAGVPASAAAPAVACVSDVPVGGTARTAVLLPGGAGDVTARIDPGWSAVLDGDRLEIGAPAGAAPGSTARVELRDGGGRRLAGRTVRAGRAGQWLSDGVPADGWTAGAGTRLTVVDGTFVCSPVFHAPIPGPIIEVSGPDLAPDTTRWVRLALPDGADLREAAFAFADFDLCAPGPGGRTVVPVLRLTAADGTTAEGTERPLPACWNRVCVDLSGLASRGEIVEVAVGARWLDTPDPARGPLTPLDGGVSPLDFRVARIGWTSGPRTW
ncbi:family 78 glycoside hydrolase catalytic domain [Streptomyces sp. V4-01]|uniref:alpha-L-rhamnosidase n=1 Tax=Actinacidiphila polyblastidii TaxID=3110430 RepID=A0ABU7P3I2_9ACTN|nr:family 78 glycoside hydrolase catalytic domain [Streptomyces sp. V4-01]